MKRFLRRFLPRSRSPAIFFFVATCYILAWEQVAPTVVRLLGWWPMATDASTGVAKPINLGLNATQNLLSVGLEILIIAPIVESLFIIGIIALLRRLKYSSLVQVAVAALCISLCHAVPRPTLALLVAPEFFIGAASYVYWRQTSFKLAAGMLVGLHVVGNAVPVLREIGRRKLGI